MGIHGDRIGRLVELSPFKELRPGARLFYGVLIGWLVLTGVTLAVVRVAAVITGI
jgi:hypothetical protein